MKSTEAKRSAVSGRRSQTKMTASKNRKAKIQNPKSKLPLIVLINDDGIKSPGLRAMARELMELGEVLIVAPRDQQTSTGRSFRGGGVPERMHFEIGGKSLRAYAVAATPAMVMRYAILVLADRPPTLVVSGINYGENVGNGVTISGTLGAALEAAAMKFPALTVSLSVAQAYHQSHSQAVDFTAAADWGKRFARKILKRGMPRGADIVNLNVPDGATRRTPYRWTSVSRMNYFRSVVKETGRGPVIDGYEQMLDRRDIEPGSDIYAVLIDRVVSVSLLSLDLTARVPKSEIARWRK